MYGSIKVVDGLFITDEIAAHVSILTSGSRVHFCKQSYPSDQLFKLLNSKSLELDWDSLFVFQLVRRRNFLSLLKRWNLWENIQFHWRWSSSSWKRHHTWNRYAKYQLPYSSSLSYAKIQMDFHESFRLPRNETTYSSHLSAYCYDLWGLSKPFTNEIWLIERWLGGSFSKGMHRRTSCTQHSQKCNARYDAASRWRLNRKQKHRWNEMRNQLDWWSRSVIGYCNRKILNGVSPAS